MKEKASKASAKHTGVGGGVCERREQEELRGCRHLWKKVGLLGSSPCYHLVTNSSPLDQLTKLDQQKLSSKLLV